jgi:hypothetical protein
MRLFMLALAVALGACADTLDERIDEHYWELPEWSHFDTYGDTPGHGDSYRIIYFNDQTRDFIGGAFPDGSTIVKEVYDNDGGSAGKLRVIEIMRRDGAVDPATLYDARMGWVFSATSTRGGEETDRSDFCWRRCHANAPVSGAWFDYGALP